MWVLRLLLTLNCRSHIWHWYYGFMCRIIWALKFIIKLTLALGIPWILSTCVIIWALMLILKLNFRSHILHWNFGFKWILSTCLIMWSCSQIWHWNYGFKRHLFMCVTKWALRLLLTLNLRSQIWHWNGRAPVCILSWLSKSLRRAKAFPQKAQECLFCASCWSWVFNNENSWKPEKWNIRIYPECEGRIEKSALRIAVWHHEACRVMTNGDPEGSRGTDFSILPSHE